MFDCHAAGAFDRLLGFTNLDRVFRIPVMAAYVVMCMGMAPLARPKESRHAAELFGGRDAGDAVLARRRRRHLHGVVSAAWC